jgi:hypothetical protein
MALSLDVNSLKRKTQEDFDDAENLAWKEAARNLSSTRKKHAADQRKIILQLTRSKTTGQHHGGSNTRRVRFSDQLAVVHIPSVADYCLESRENMWGTREEQKRSILRNKLESAFEKVLKEEQFVCKEQYRNAVHPFHKHFTVAVSLDVNYLKHKMQEELEDAKNLLGKNQTVIFVPREINMPPIEDRFYYTK